MVADLLDAHTAALFLSDRTDHRFLELRAYHSLSDHIMPWSVIERGEGLVGWVYKEQRPLHVNRFDHDSATLGIYSEDVGIRAFLAVPLPDRLGVLMVDTRDRHGFPEKLQRILARLSCQGAMLIKSEAVRQQARLFRELLQWQKDFVSGGLESGEAFMALLGCMEMELLLVTRHWKQSRIYSITEIHGGPGMETRGRGLLQKRFSMDSGLAGWIFRHGREIVLDRFGRDSQVSYLIYPDDGLGSGNVVVGLFLGGESSGSRDNAADGVVSMRPDHAVVLRGSPDIWWWPEDIAAIIKPLVWQILDRDTPGGLVAC